MWSQAVDEALCFGWIDGRVNSVDGERHIQRFTPRKPASNWSAVNIAKVAQLRAEGRMRPAGEAAFARRRPERSGVYSYEQRHEARLEPEQQARFEADGRGVGLVLGPVRRPTARSPRGGWSARSGRRRASAGSRR